MTARLPKARIQQLSTLLVLGVVWSAVFAAFAFFRQGQPDGLGDLARRISLVADSIRSADDAFADGFLAACGNPCWINSNRGGYVSAYQALARLAKQRQRQFIVNGDCASACAMFADLARPMVAITETASFAFHKTSTETAPPMSDDIAAWVASHGGLPAFASGDTTAMPFAEAKAFWPEIGTRAHPLNLSDLRGAR